MYQEGGKAVHESRIRRAAAAAIGANLLENMNAVAIEPLARAVPRCPPLGPAVGIELVRFLDLFDSSGQKQSLLRLLLARICAGYPRAAKAKDISEAGKGNRSLRCVWQSEV